MERAEFQRSVVTGDHIDIEQYLRRGSGPGSRPGRLIVQYAGRQPDDPAYIPQPKTAAIGPGPESTRARSKPYDPNATREEMRPARASRE